MKHPNEIKKPLTRKGHSQLADEHERLARQERPKVVEGIAIAAAEGDRSENAEYIYGKKKLRELDRRIRYLNKLLTNAQIIDPASLSGNQVAFGATVEVAYESGERHTWIIVGEGESDYYAHAVSWKAPVARALWGKTTGDIVLVHRPAGPRELQILSIYYI